MQLPKSLSEWANVTAVLLAFGAGGVSYAVAKDITSHNDNEKAHPELQSKIQGLKAQLDGVANDLRHTREIADLTQVQNEREHQKQEGLLRQILSEVTQ